MTIALPLTFGGWQIIFADPPWRFASNSKAKPGRNAMRHYECMTFKELQALPVAEIAAPVSLLCMWVTVPFAEHGYQLSREWGFKPVSQLVWPKQRIATGYWARNRHEFIIIAKRGRFPCERPALFSDSVIPGDQRDHSRKPEWPQEQIDKRFPNMRKLELFARRPRAGWQVMGNETEKFEGIGQ
ncbi:hypothetical protein BMI86_10175 [Thioclava sp. DLFJ5-1]|uniref:MT-A70 family methyltransferase n=1 Tax=Thioclava sp. DLFJ5-1 TaxID=1915314 RepID=UPI0009CBCCE1|nr:MT-A70 family methyltransferase [Thioclava sp. DLFJ5-1]OOY20864.1 hypothetical protein BMI86_10175 [Thioclava sp. DLFJ5-1]